MILSSLLSTTFKAPLKIKMDDFGGRFGSSVACSTPFSSPNYTRFQRYVHSDIFVYLSTSVPSFDMLFKRLNDRNYETGNFSDHDH